MQCVNHCCNSKKNVNSNKLQLPIRFQPKIIDNFSLYKKKQLIFTLKELCTLKILSQTLIFLMTKWKPIQTGRETKKTRPPPSNRHNWPDTSTWWTYFDRAFIKGNFSPLMALKIGHHRGFFNLFLLRRDQLEPFQRPTAIKKTKRNSFPLILKAFHVGASSLTCAFYCLVYYVEAAKRV